MVDCWTKISFQRKISFVISLMPNQLCWIILDSRDQTTLSILSSSSSMLSSSSSKSPSYLARYTTASIFAGIISAWVYFAYPAINDTPGLTSAMHGYSVPLALTLFYLISLPSLKWITETFLAPKYDMKLLLTESMILYNVAQVFLNGWMVYAILNAIWSHGHPFIGSRSVTGVAIHSGASYAVWVHYCDKYLEFLDTYFMILRGKMDQVSYQNASVSLVPTILLPMMMLCPPRRWSKHV